MTLRALPVYPWPLGDERMAVLRRAKADLALDYKIQPIQAHPGEDLPVLSFGFPPFVCRAAMIRDGWDVGNVRSALEAVLEHPDHPAMLDAAGWLSAVLGVPVKEVVE